MSYKKLRTIGVILCLTIVVTACETPSQFRKIIAEETNIRKVTIMYDAIIEKLKTHDESVITQCVAEQDGVVQNILDAFESFDLESRMLSLTCFALKNTTGSANALLKATYDEDLNVANEAVSYLHSQAHMVPSIDLFTAVASQDEPYIREQLYLIIGNSEDADLILQLRELHNNEDDPDAANAALVALVKLHAEPERVEFMQVFHNAEATEAVDLTEKLLYIGDASWAKALRPWLMRYDEVFRLASDRTPDAMVRMCDLAIWTSHQMGLKFQPPLERIAIFKDDVISQADFLLSQIN